MQNSKVLITGHRGFIGAALTSYLVSHDIFPILPGSNCQFLAIDYIKSLIGKNFATGIDTIVYLSTYHHIRSSSSNYDLSLSRKINYSNVIDLASIAKSVGIKRFIFFSSINVFGISSDGKPHVYSASDVPVPSDVYGLYKSLSETDLMSLAEPGIFDVIILRLPLVIGSNSGSNFSSLIKLAYYGIPVPFSAFKLPRSYIFIDNLVVVIHKILIDHKIQSGVFHLSDFSASISEIMSLLYKEFGRPNLCFYCPIFVLRFLSRLFNFSSQINRINDGLQIDSSLVFTTLNLQPKYDLPQSIGITVKNFLCTLNLTRN